MEYDVFISYRRKNGFEMAQLICDRLTEKGLKCFLDLEEMRAGKFDEKIIDSINNSSNFILVLPRYALDRCVNEDDWVRKEIVAATGKCTIIPILYPNFSWPKKLYKDLPEEITSLERQQGVPLSREYFSAMIDKIISYMTDVEVHTNKKENLYVESSKFIMEKVKSTENVLSVDMAFHAGSEWRRNTEMVNVLSTLYSMGIKMRVIINSPKAAEEVCGHMRQPFKKYVKFESNVEEWTELAKEYPDKIELRVLDIPLLHRLYIVRGENSGSANVKYYSYGNYKPENDFRLTFNSPDDEYTLYKEEFEYLWNIANKS